MSQVSIHVAQTNLSRLIERVHAGEEVIIAQGKRPVARLMSVDQHQKRGRMFGAMRGKAVVDGAFFDPLPEKELAAWES